MDWSSTPDARRGTVNARFRVRPEANDLVRRLAEEMGDTATNVAVALLQVGATHQTEVRKVLERLREDPPQKKVTPGP